MSPAATQHIGVDFDTKQFKLAHGDRRWHNDVLVMLQMSRSTFQRNAAMKVYEVTDRNTAFPLFASG